MKPINLELATLKAIGAAMTGNSTIAAQQFAEAGLSQADFQSPELGLLFATLAKLIQERRPLDAVSLVKALGKQVGNDTILAVATSSDFGVLAERARVLKDANSRRKLVAGLESALRMAKDEAVGLEEAAGEGAKALEAARSVQTAAMPASGDLAGILDRIQQVQDGKMDPVLKTGIHGLDAAIGGLQQTLTVIGALPGVGKSALLAAIVRNLARRGVRSGVFSLEDARDWVAKRILSETSAVPLFVLGNRPLNGAQHGRLEDGFSRAWQDLQHVMIDDRTGMTAADIVASARQMVVTQGVKAIFVDHLGEVRLGPADRHDLAINAALQELRALAKVHGVPVVVFAHMKRREGLSRAEEPTLTDFAFSSGVERMARVALGLSRPCRCGSDGGSIEHPQANPCPQDTLCVTVLKQTSGQADVSVDLPFRGPAGLVGNGEPLRNPDAAYERQEQEMQRWGNE